MPTKAPPRLSIARIFEPRRVAVFGASDDRDKWGGRIMHYLALHGFAGEIVPLNPRRDVVQGRKCYARIADAPPIDVAVIAVPAPVVPQTVRECAAAGVGCCVIITAGFAEVGAEGVAAQDEIARVSTETGMRLVGPNCLGLINLRNGMALTSARVLDVEKIIPGHIGLLSQSGALMLSVYNRAHDQGIGFSQLVSVGNQADLDICDFFEHMIADPVTQAICLHIEGLRDGRRLLELLGRARDAQKPVIVLKTGRSADGEAAARSHTASLAGAYPVFAAACREAGAVLVDDPDVMAHAADFILRNGASRGDGIGIISSSGGMNGIVVDRFADHGLRLARFNDATRDALKAVMLPGHCHNPVDMGTRRQEVGEVRAIAAPLVAALAGDPDVGLIMIPLTTTPHYEASVAALAEALRSCGTPALFVVTPGSVATGVRAIIREAGLAHCDRLDDGLRLLQAYFGYRPDRSRRSISTAPRAAPPIPRSGYLSEPEVKVVLAAAGLRVTREQRVRSAAEAGAAANEIGYPVVLKGISGTVVHKSDAGLVRLGLGDRAAVEAAFAEVFAKLRRLDPAAEDCLVSEMVTGRLELILGAKRDPQFGAVVMVGAGGVLVELIGDVEVALAPLSAETAESMLKRLRVWPLLQGFRGYPRRDIAAVVDALVKLGELAAALEGRLLELDVNPLLVGPEGEGAVAADARAVLA
ncbi:MAG TPA: acetate--CoA ligase family protein [Stellaceae bacterium]|nr:acetate--CoA ligase family protein [Stellaceae bacterium]